jgi:hypothetical protein
MKSRAGLFSMIASQPGQAIGIQLRFASGVADTSLVAEALDGGVIPQAQANSSLASDGTAAVQFQVGSKSGLYRVALNQGGNVSLFQFWVADPGSAATNRAAIQPSTGN